jgi:hypothetical protein
MAVRQRASAPACGSLDGGGVKAVPRESLRHQREGTVVALVKALVEQHQPSLRRRAGKVEGIRQQRADIGGTGPAQHQREDPSDQYHPAVAQRELGAATHLVSILGA